MRFFSVLLFLMTSSLLYAQESNEAKMAFFADVMINAEEKAHRITAHRAFKPLLEASLEQDSFENEYTSLKWISIQYPQDSSFRLFSWQLMHTEDKYEYFGYIQKADGSVIKLNQGNDDLVDLPYMRLNKDEWIGCLFYKVISFKQGEKDLYVLFGYNANNKYDRIKVADVLDFGEDRITLGRPVFVDMDSTGRGDVMNRLILKYSADSNTNLNYNPALDMIVFDHLIPVGGRMEGQGLTAVPDGTYKGYKLDEKGNWIYVDKIFDHTYDDAPRPKPVLNTQRGKSKN